MSDQKPTREPLVRVVDLAVGEAQVVALCNGEQAEVRLVGLQERRDSILSAMIDAAVQVEVNGEPVTLKAALYHLPVTAAGVQIDCPVTRGSVQNSHMDHWGMEKDARFRLWPEGSPLAAPGTLVYPAVQRWFASRVWFANEPVSPRPNGQLYYHAQADIGGAEGMVEVVAAAAGKVVLAGTEVAGDIEALPLPPRYDVVSVVDDRGWFYRYSHLASMDVKAGQTVEMGQKIGTLGKEGSSGGWAHLHFDIRSRMPSGKWGSHDCYAFLWEAYRNTYGLDVMAVAQPRSMAYTGEEVVLDGTRSWSADGILEYEWTLSDGQAVREAKVARTYDLPGNYSEILKVTDGEGRVAYDFAMVAIHGRNRSGSRRAPGVHLAYDPTMNLRPGDPVTFKARGFGLPGCDIELDFGDGSPAVNLPADGNEDPHAEEGYATTVHSYAQPGDYVVRARRVSEEGIGGAGHVHVRVE